MADKDFIGRGWSFPPSFDRRSGEVRMLSGEDDIDSSLHILLSTTIGERVMQPRYGCNLKQFQFEPLNDSMQFRMRKMVEDAILYFEPRIRLDGLDLVVDQAEGRVVITVEYIIKTSHSRGSFVFPFYLGDRDAVRPASAGGVGAEMPG